MSGAKIIAGLQDALAFEQGRTAERAAIVAWLRKAVEREAPTGRPVYMLVEAADAIERTAHREGD